MVSEVLLSVKNQAIHRFGRRFPGLDAPHPALSRTIAPREAEFFNLSAGDVLSFRPFEPSSSPKLAAFAQNGEPALKSLGLSANSALAPSEFASQRFIDWIAGNGGRASDEIVAFRMPSLPEPFIVKAEQPCTVWIVNAVTAENLLNIGGVGRILVELKKANTALPLLPPPLGDVRDEFTVPKASAHAYELCKGEVVQIIDIEGQQCSDFLAFRADALHSGREKMIDSTVTRTFVGGAYPMPGLFDKFLDSDIRPLLKLMQDTVGRHDTFALACTARGYEERGFPGHVNCSDNISNELAPYGVKRRAAWPAINFFFNSWINHTDNRLRSEEAWSRPGDYVALQAMDDLVCVSTACPDDIDPINGWNPTDIHVRIYKPQAPIRRAVAYREKEDNVLAISQESPFHARTSVLTQQFQPARDLWLPVSFPSVGTIGEYWACRNAVTLQDMSGLRKFDIIGPDAETLLQRAMTRDVAKLAVWRGTYSLICDDQGTVIDDGTLFRIGPDLFRWCCGSEESGRALSRLANREGLQVRITALGGAMPNLALQGPNSRDLLREIVFTQPHVPALDDMKWFGATMARLRDRDGAPFMLTRSGYTGELGYEIFCDRSNALEIWDALIEAGNGHDIQPMGNAALDILRIEAGLMAAGTEFTSAVDAFEAGLGFAVDLRKSDFVGKPALERNAASQRRLLKGLVLDTDEVATHGQHVFAGERPVGVVTSATRSPFLECGIAMARLSVEHADSGTELEIGQMDGRMKRLSAKVVDIPFVDPQRKRARS
ncbi:DUF1989 domain-containing protein [Hoeflea sp. TYP-13]|uniref:DUF1989 domain-containing protein n=1 Tax=Hoeflea sp. TYP-13 TaxID=3230023 RepID=UPI0034C6DA07